MAEAGDFARNRPQAEALGGVVGGALQLAVVERQALALDVFEEQLAVVAALQGLVDGLAGLAQVERSLAEKEAIGGREMIDALWHVIFPCFLRDSNHEDDLPKMGIGLHLGKR